MMYMTLNLPSRTFHYLGIWFKHILKLVVDSLKTREDYVVSVKDCKLLLSELSDKSNLTRLEKLKKVRWTSPLGFSEMVREALPEQSATRLIAIVAAGSYSAAQKLYDVTYEECYRFVSSTYNTLLAYVAKTFVREKTEAELFYMLLRSYEDKVEALYNAQTKYAERFERLLNSAVSSPRTRKKVLSYISYKTTDKVCDAYSICSTSVRSTVMRAYRSMLLADNDPELPFDTKVYISSLDLLGKRCRRILCSNNCTSFTDVRNLLKRYDVEGMGNGVRKNIENWLLEVGC